MSPVGAPPSAHAALAEALARLAAAWWRARQAEVPDPPATDDDAVLVPARAASEPSQP